MLIANQNFAGRQPELHDGDVIEDCNLSQDEPRTPLSPGIRRLTFRRCNLVNCLIEPDATVIDCNTAQVRYVRDETGAIAEAVPA